VGDVADELALQARQPLQLINLFPDGLSGSVQALGQVLKLGGTRVDADFAGKLAVGHASGSFTNAREGGLHLVRRHEASDEGEDEGEDHSQHEHQLRPLDEVVERRGLLGNLDDQIGIRPVQGRCEHRFPLWIGGAGKAGCFAVEPAQGRGPREGVSRLRPAGGTVARIGRHHCNTEVRQFREILYDVASTGGVGLLHLYGDALGLIAERLLHGRTHFSAEDQQYVHSDRRDRHSDEEGKRKHHPRLRGGAARQKEIADRANEGHAGYTKTNSVDPWKGRTGT
jgi:hypothetical protein